MDDVVRVLLVDDQVRNLEVLEAVLAASGCQLVSATSADQALLALLDQDFAAIVLDIRMPGTNGLELARLIKQRKRTEHVPILFLTAHLLDEKDVLRGYAVGAVDYLTKPLHPEILRAKIAVFVDLYRKRRALSISNASLEREVSEREAAQAALRQVNQELERRVRERTAEVLHAHDELRSSEERLRLALDAGRMGTWELDESSGTTRIDDAAAALLGLDRRTRTLSNDSFFTLIHPDDRAGVRKAIDDARAGFAAGSRAFELEFRVIWPTDGSEHWLMTRGCSVPEDEGRPCRTVGVGVEITQGKRTERALKEADQRKNDFLATLAHELRNPLAPIRNAVQILLLKGERKADLDAARQVIARQTRQLTRLVDDLLDISRITRDKLELRRERIPLSRIVQVAVETSQPLVTEGRHSLTVSIPDEPAMVHADLTRMAQVISNLLNNAAKYSEPGGRITLTVTREGSDAVIRVCDTGMGIPPTLLPHVFEMFVQSDRTRERAHGGLGVGLALAKRLVEMHDGTIEVRSNDGSKDDGSGSGSEFIVRLPLLTDTTTHSVSREESEFAAHSSSLRVLVVDDNVDAVETLSMLLRLMGNDVRSAHDGEQAIRTAADFRPHVVLLDIGLPKMNGYEVARRLRAEPWGRDMFLVALTGWGQDSDRQRSYESGFDQHLVKPVEPAALMNLIGGTRQQRVPPAAEPIPHVGECVETPAVADERIPSSLAAYTKDRVEHPEGHV